MVWPVARPARSRYFFSTDFLPPRPISTQHRRRFTVNLNYGRPTAILNCGTLTNLRAERYHQPLAVTTGGYLPRRSDRLGLHHIPGQVTGKGEPSAIIVHATRQPLPYKKNLLPDTHTITPSIVQHSCHGPSAAAMRTDYTDHQLPDRPFPD